MNESTGFNSKGFHTALLFAAFVGLFFFGTLDNGRGPAYPEIMNQLGLTNRQGSLLFALTSFTGFLMTAFSSSWLRLFDLLKGMRLSWLVLSLASFLIGVSGFLKSPLLLFSAAVIQGIGMGVAGMNMNLMVEAGAPVTHRRRTYGALHATYGIASFFAPLFFTGVKMLGLSWEYFFIILALLGPLLFIFLPAEGGVPAKITPKTHDLKLPLPFLIIMGMTVGTYVASEIVISSRLVLFLEEGNSLSNAQAGLYLAAFFILLMAGRLSLSLINISLSGPVLMTSSLILTGIFCWLGMKGQFFFFSLTGLSMSVFFPSFMDWVADCFPDKFQRVITFVMSGIGLHLVVMHLGFGQLADILGVVQAMGLALYLTGTSFILLMICLLWARSLRTSAK